METIKNNAIKYLVIFIGAWAFHQIYISVPLFVEPINSVNSNILTRYFQFGYYLDNLIIGTFLLFDTKKHIRNNIQITFLGYLVPLFGVCFYLIERFYLITNVEYE